ncbi:hypothetical protein BHE74_00008260 [Ensete ventricosum]|nr:hypothetical protein BHE74_00008260 [Ensete ventricosum]RZR82516.1 hypothetical protein BHM03_00008964 [Ensete ventricosum]
MSSDRNSQETKPREIRAYRTNKRTTDPPEGKRRTQELPTMVAIRFLEATRNLPCRSSFPSSRPRGRRWRTSRDRERDGRGGALEEHSNKRPNL